MKFRPIFDRNEARKAKPQVGDLVQIGDGQQYRISACGLRYARLETADTGRSIGMVALQDVRRIDAVSAQEPSPLDELRRGHASATFDKSTLLRK